MKLLLIPILSAICILPVTDQIISAEKKTTLSPHANLSEETGELVLQDGPGQGKISSIEFKSQNYCRAELENFEFDARFAVVSATVYFSGANFREVQRGFITSSSLKPIKHLMAQCTAGSVVVFDDVKVKGPDNEIRTIPGVSLILH